ncbi:MAG: hypothetical protein RLZZ237_2310, partial [Pseudomonadota bacterium]
RVLEFVGDDFGQVALDLVSHAQAARWHGFAMFSHDISMLS